MTATIQNIFTRTQFILLASLLALVFLCAPSAHASEAIRFDVDVKMLNADSKGNVEIDIDDATSSLFYAFYFDGNVKPTDPNISGMKDGGMFVGVFNLKPGQHTLVVKASTMQFETKAVSYPVSFFVGTDVVKPTVGLPTDAKNARRNIYPFTAEAISSTQIDLSFNCTVPNTGHSCKIHQDGKLIKTFEVKTKDYGRYMTYSVKNLTPNTKYSFVVVESAKKGSLPDKPTVNTFSFTPTLSVKTPKATSDTSTPVPTCRRSTCPATPSITILSPNGGETYKAGDPITLTWEQNYKSRKLVISLFNNETGRELYNDSHAKGEIGRNSVTLRSYATESLGGKYRITICDNAKQNPTVAGKPLCDVSNEAMTIASATPVTCQAIGCTTDKTAPTAPKNLKAVADSATQVTLTWGASTDAGTGILGYQILRNNPNYKTGSNTELPFVMVSDLTTNLSFVDTGLKPATSYEYTVTALDKAKEANSSHSGVTVKTPSAPVGKDTTAPSVPGTATVTNLNAISGKGWAVTLGWGKTTDDVGVTGYVVKQISSNPVTTITTTGTETEISGLVLGAENTVEVRAKDAQGNLSAARVVKFKLNFNGMGTAPTIQILSNTPEVKTVSMVSPKPVTVTVPVPEPTPTPTRRDTTAPTVPSRFMVGGYAEKEITLSWVASTDAGGIKGYNIYRGSSVTPVNTTIVTGLQFTEFKLTPDTSYTYTIEAVDLAGNKSSKANITGKTRALDTVAPTTPTGFKATIDSSTQITLSWGASTDVGSGLQGYIIYRNGSDVALSRNVITDLTYVDKNLTPGTTYTYSIEAIDRANDSANKSVRASVTAKTLAAPVAADTVAPSVPSDFRVTASTTSSITLAWNASTDASGIKGYNIYRDTNIIPRNATVVTGTTFTDGGLTQGTSYTYTIEAIDNATNKSTKGTVTGRTASPIVATAVATPAPTCSLKANKSSYILGETITYSWTSTNATYAGWAPDTSGKDHLILPGDKLAANGTQAVPASVTGNPPVTLTMGGVGGTGSCSLTVAVSSPVPTVTIDKTVPSVPVSASVANVLTVPGAGWSAVLSWGASTDNVGVTGYVVKNIAPTAGALTTTTGKTFTLTGLVLTSEYTVSIQAKDARGNLGPARVVKFRLNFAGMGAVPTVQIISNTVDTTVQKVVAQTPTSVPLTSAGETSKIETLTALMNKLIELQAMLASVKGSR